MKRRPLKRFFLFKFLLFVIIQSCALGQTDSGAAQDEVVCITSTGKKYHLCTCQYLNKSKIEIDLSDAQARYTPCLVCKPDRLRKLGRVQPTPDESGRIRHGDRSKQRATVSGRSAPGGWRDDKKQTMLRPHKKRNPLQTNDRAPQWQVFSARSVELLRFMSL